MKGQICRRWSVEVGWARILGAQAWDWDRGEDGRYPIKIEEAYIARGYVHSLSLTTSLLNVSQSLILSRNNCQEGSTLILIQFQFQFQRFHLFNLNVTVTTTTSKSKTATIISTRYWSLRCYYGVINLLLHMRFSLSRADTLVLALGTLAGRCLGPLPVSFPVTSHLNF